MTEVWRIWFRWLDGRHEYVDVEGCSPRWGRSAAVNARDVMRERHGETRGWWMEAWQPLIVPAGTEPPPLRRRLYVARRRLRNVLAPGDHDTPAKGRTGEPDA